MHTSRSIHTVRIQLIHVEANESMLLCQFILAFRCSLCGCYSSFHILGSCILKYCIFRPDLIFSHNQNSKEKLNFGIVPANWFLANTYLHPLSLYICIFMGLGVYIMHREYLRFACIIIGIIIIVMHIQGVILRCMHDSDNNACRIECARCSFRTKSSPLSSNRMRMHSTNNNNNIHMSACTPSCLRWRPNETYMTYSSNKHLQMHDTHKTRGA